MKVDAPEQITVAAGWLGSTLPVGSDLGAKSGQIPAAGRSPVRRGVGPLIHQTILDLHNAGRVATRSLVQELTGQNYGVVDDHVKRMLEDGRLRRVSPGVFEPVIDLPPAQAISLTVLPSGMAKLEVGDICLDLNPSDRRTMGALFQGSAAELAGLQNARELTDSVEALRRLFQSTLQQVPGSAGAQLSAG